MRFTFSENYIVGLNFALIAAVSFFASQIFIDIVKWHLVGFEPPAAKATAEPARTVRNRTRSQYQYIVERDIFNKVKQVQAPVVVKAFDLHLRLLGTSQFSRSRPYAVIEDEISRKQALYRLNDEIPGVGRLVAVEKDRVLIERNSQRVVLEMPKPVAQSSTQVGAPVVSSGIRRVGINHWEVSRATVDSSLQNMGQLLMQARATPNLQNGKIEGFKITDIQPGSLFSQLGLQNGDIITKVEGEEINDPARALEMLNLLRDRQSLSLTVLRNGQPVTLSFDIR